MLCVLAALYAVPAFGQITLQPSSTSGPAVSIVPSSGGMTSGDMFEIQCPAPAVNPCFFVNLSGGLGFDGNALSLGTAPQLSESSLTLYGGGGYPGYIQEYNAGIGPAPAPMVSPMGTTGTINGYASVCITYDVPAGETPCDPNVNENTAYYTNANQLNVSRPTQLGSTFGTVNGWYLYAGSCTVNGCAAGSIYRVGSIHTTYGGGTVPITSIPTSGTTPPATDGTGTPAQFSGFWYVSPTTSGIPCFSNNALATTNYNADCATGASSGGSAVLAFNPMTTPGDIIVGGSLPSSGLTVAAPQALHPPISGTNNFLQWTGSAEAWTAPSVTFNGVTVSASNSGDVNAGAAANSVAINEGAGNSIQGATCGAGTVLQGAASGNPTCTATPSLGGSGTTGSVAYAGSTSGNVTHTVPNSVTTYTETDPGAAPTNSNSMKIFSSGATASFQRAPQYSSFLTGTTLSSSSTTTLATFNIDTGTSYRIDCDAFYTASATGNGLGVEVTSTASPNPTVTLAIMANVGGGNNQGSVTTTLNSLIGSDVSGSTTSGYPTKIMAYVSTSTSSGTVTVALKALSGSGTVATVAGSSCIMH